MTVVAEWVRVKRWLVSALALCAALLSGCSALTLHPRDARQIQGASISLKLESIRVNGPPRGGSGSRVEIAVRVLSASAPLVPLVVVIADPRTAPCMSPPSSDQLRVLGTPYESPVRALRAGDVVVMYLDGSDWRLALSGPSRLDVVLQDERGPLHCATFPLVDANPEIALESETDWALGTGVAGEGFVGSLGDVNGIIEFPFTVGRWAGPARLTASFSPGVAQCPESICEAQDEDKVDNAPYVPLKLGADMGRSFGLVRLALGAEYRVAAARVDARAGSYWMLLHGPTLRPRFGISFEEAMAPGVPGGERIGGFIGLEAPMSLVWSSRGARALGIGGALVWMFPLH